MSAKSYDLRPDAIGVAELSRLRRQAETLFDFEMLPLRRVLGEAAAIIDLGSGAGDYLHQSRKYNASAELVAIEKNPFVIKNSKVRLSKFLEMDVFDYLNLDNAAETPQPILYLVRFVLQHMAYPAVATLFRLLAQRRGEAVIIECDDSGFSCNSDDVARLHAGLVKRQEQNGGNRYLGGKLARIASEAGIEVIATRRLVYSLDSIGLENMTDVFVRLLAANNRVEIDPERQMAIGREILFCSYVLHLKLRP